MKKRIFSILLVMALVFTMTACVTNSDTQSATSEETIITTVDPTTVVIATPEKIEPDLKVLRLSPEVIEAMTPEKVSAWFDEMIQLSKTATLSEQDMQNIGRNFEAIWFYGKHTFEKDEYEAKAYETFMNIYNQAIEQHISLEEIKSWTWVPVADVLEQYFSSDKFYFTDKIVCDVLYELSEEDAIRVAKAFYSNPLFDTNCSLTLDAIYNPNEEVQKMGVERLMTLSKSANPKIVEQIDEDFILGVYFTENIVEYFPEFAKNIMENPAHDLVSKYEFFYKGGFSEDVANLAFEHLIKLAQNADEETSELIKQVAGEIYDDEAANQLLDALEK